MKMVALPAMGLTCVVFCVPQRLAEPSDNGPKGLGLAPGGL